MKPSEIKKDFVYENDAGSLIKVVRLEQHGDIRAVFVENGAPWRGIRDTVAEFASKMVRGIRRP